VAKVNKKDQAEMRKKAEQIVKDSGLQEKNDRERLIYELKVHQIELELQNEELKESQLELQKSRKLFESFFEMAPIGYFILDKEGVIQDVNYVGAKLLKTGRKYLYQKPFVVYLPETYHKIFFDHMNKTLESGEKLAIELHLTDRNGEKLWVHMETALSSLSEKKDHILTAVLDMTERKKMEEDILFAREEAIKANKVKSMFLANMSHEIRTPMNGILSMSELALNTALEPDQKKYIEAVYHSAQSLLTIVNDILDFSKIEAEKVDIHNENFAVDRLLDELYQLFFSQMSGKDIALEFHREDGPVRHLFGDLSKIRQILINLLSNAVKFTKEGSITLKSSLKALDDKDRYLLRIEVRDTGIGISKDKIKSIFNSFTQVDNSYRKEFQGTGLGLAISKRLAEIMDGDIQVVSDEDKGSRFILSVPVSAAHPSGEAHAGTHETPEPAEKSNILIAEDNAINILYLQTLLEKEGHSVTSVYDGNEALTKIKENSYDLILMDISMPHMDGVSATKKIREGEMNGTKNGIPIIAITAHAMQSEKDAFKEAGITDFIFKPFSRSVILKKIKEYTGRLGDS
jgi:PAS domain S-box-containing protein